MCYKFKKIVPHRGFEPLISTVRVSCPGPARRMWLLSHVLSNTVQKYVFFLTRHRFFLLFSEEKVVIITTSIDFLIISFTSNQGSTHPVICKKQGSTKALATKNSPNKGLQPVILLINTY